MTTLVSHVEGANVEIVNQQPDLTSLHLDKGTDDGLRIGQIITISEGDSSYTSSGWEVSDASPTTSILTKSLDTSDGFQITFRQNMNVPVYFDGTHVFIYKTRSTGAYWRWPEELSVDNLDNLNQQAAAGLWLVINGETVAKLKTPAEIEESYWRSPAIWSNEKWVNLAGVEYNLGLCDESLILNDGLSFEIDTMETYSLETGFKTVGNVFNPIEIISKEQTVSMGTSLTLTMTSSQSWEYSSSDGAMTVETSLLGTEAEFSDFKYSSSQVVLSSTFNQPSVSAIFETAGVPLNNLPDSLSFTISPIIDTDSLVLSGVTRTGLVSKVDQYFTIANPSGEPQPFVTSFTMTDEILVGSIGQDQRADLTVTRRSTQVGSPVVNT